MILLNARIDKGAAHFDFARVNRNCKQARDAFEDQLQNAKIALTLGTSWGPEPPWPR